MKFIKQHLVNMLLAMLLIFTGFFLWYFGAHLIWNTQHPLVHGIARIKIISAIMLILLLITLAIIVIRIWARKRMIEKLLIVPTDKSSDDYRKFQYFTKVLHKALRRSFITKDGSRVSINSLPWYLVFGPPGAGKSSLIQKSGLHFPLSDALGDKALDELKRFRRFEWRITAEGVFVEIYRERVENEANDWQSLNVEREWRDTLALIRRLRGRSAINGIILAVDAPSLFNNDNVKNDILAEAGVQRIESILSYFKSGIPLYVMITKCDLIMGFNEYFSNKEDYFNSSLGYTIERTSPLDESNVYKKATALINTIKDNLIAKLATASTVQESQAIYEFTRNFPFIIQATSKILVAAMEKSHNHLKNVRGIFFSSALEGGNANNPSMRLCADNLGLMFNSNVFIPSDRTSRFIKGFFEKVVYVERNLISVGTKASLWLYRFKKFFNVVIFSLAILGCFGLLYSFYVSRQNLVGTYQYVKRFILADNLVKHSPPDNSASLRTELLDLLDTVAPLEKARQSFAQSPLDTVGIPMWASLEILQQPIVELETNYLKKNFTPLLIVYFRDKLRDNTVPVYRLIENLVVYKQLSEGTGDINKVNEYFRLLWQASPFQFSDEDIKQLLTYFGLINKTKFSFPTLDKSIFSNARNRINESTLSDITYAKIRDHLKNSNLVKMNLHQILDSDYETVFDEEKLQNINISMFYTRSTYQAQFQNLAKFYTQEMVDDLKYLNLMPASAPKVNIVNTVLQELQTQYYDDYAFAWTEIVEQFQIVPVKNINQLSKQFQVLSRVQSPLKNYLEFLRSNTNFTITGAKQPISFADVNLIGIIDSLKANNKQLSKYDIVHKDLIKVSGYIDNIRYASDPDKMAFLELKAFVDGKDNTNPIRELIRDTNNSPEPLQGLLKQLTDNAIDVLRNAAWQHVVTVWNDKILPGFDMSILSQYPFSQTKFSVKINDFNRYFAQDGILAVFYNTYLEPFVESNAGKLQYRKIVGKDLSHDYQFLDKFENIDKIRRYLYLSDPKQLKVSFVVKPYELDPNSAEMAIKYGENEMIYRHGPRLGKEFNWPNSLNEDGLLFQFCGFKNDSETLTFNDSWSWFRLIQNGKIMEREKSNRYLLSVNANGHKAVLELATSMPIEILNLSLFRSLHDKDLS